MEDQTMPNETTEDRYFDRNGKELMPSDILSDMSNVHSVIRTQKMTREEFEANFGDHPHAE